MEPAPEVGLGIWYVSLAVFGTLWASFAVPYAFHVVRAVRAGDTWLPFEPKPNGRYTFMAQSRRFAAFRAPTPEHRTALGLTVRHGIGLAVIAALSYAPIRDIAYIANH
ncbi:hypothetical protein [Knoellia subterranea]|uniref:Uncharacterized protein n=1 Tax=Knoellia subterranea KCTC 19937 TaxID=1385521 RepID=A0A0A0JJX6_9MICO|nr:hypothetical protein [Knoellia subterranea]KGN37029.1 hypothetical protein N803_16565 [Knoellia subterranea KCTC 19937]